MKIYSNIDMPNIDLTKVFKKNTNSVTKVLNYNSDIKSTSNKTTDSNNEVETVEVTNKETDSINLNKSFFKDVNFNIDRLNNIGGDQSSLVKYSDYFLNSIAVKHIVHEYYPEATEEDMELLFYRINTSGCGYVAAANTIFSFFANMKDGAEQFEAFFGFPMKTNGIYNYELLYLDFFLFCASTTYIHSTTPEGLLLIEPKYKTIKEVYGNVEEEMKIIESDGALDYSEFYSTGQTGVYADTLAGDLSNYLRNRSHNDIFDSSKFDWKYPNHYIQFVPGTKAYEMSKITFNNMDFNTIPLKGFKRFQDIEPEEIKGLLEDGNKIIVTAANFDLYTLLGLPAYENVGPHAMTVMDVTDDGRLKVSSWGEIYFLDINKDKLTGMIMWNVPND